MCRLGETTEGKIVVKEDIVKPKSRSATTGLTGPSTLKSKVETVLLKGVIKVKTKVKIIVLEEEEKPKEIGMSSLLDLGSMITNNKKKNRTISSVLPYDKSKVNNSKMYDKL